MFDPKSVGNEVQIVVFGLGGEEFGVDISQVREIIKVPEVTRMPNSPEFVEGVINLRGTITPVVDLRKALNIIPGNGGNTDAVRIVIVEQGEKIIGMVVDAVSEVMRLSTGDIEANPTLTSEISAEYIRGVGKLEDRLLILLDLNKVLSQQELAKLNGLRKNLVEAEA